MRPLKRAGRAQDFGATRNGQAIAGVLIIHRIYFDLMIRTRTKKVARVSAVPTVPALLHKQLKQNTNQAAGIERKPLILAKNQTESTVHGAPSHSEPWLRVSERNKIGSKGDYYGETDFCKLRTGK